MAFFDDKNMWGGNSNKENADIRFDFENSRITMANNGVITNHDNDFRLASDGLKLNARASYGTKTGVMWDSINVNMGIYGRSVGGGDYIRAGADVIELGLPNASTLNIGLKVDTRVGFEEITANLPIRLARYSDATRPDNPLPGMIIFNTDANGIQVAGNNGNWGGI